MFRVVAYSVQPEARKTAQGVWEGDIAEHAAVNKARRKRSGLCRDLYALWRIVPCIGGFCRSRKCQAPLRGNVCRCGPRPQSYFVLSHLQSYFVKYGPTTRGGPPHLISPPTFFSVKAFVWLALCRCFHVSSNPRQVIAHKGRLNKSKFSAKV